MFTGIVEEMGTVMFCDAARGIGIRAKKVIEGTRIGDSIAVNGVCLTVTRIDADQIHMDMMPETIRTSALGHLKSRSQVNLERALSTEARFGGHIISGHIDCTGVVTKRQCEKSALWLAIRVPQTRYVVEKGSIAVDGISLTVSKLVGTTVWVSLIPHTASQTTLADRRPGDRVNIEFDIIGKYCERSENTTGNGITMQDLRASGY